VAFGEGVSAMKETGEIELTFDEDERHTSARASLVIRGATFTGSGRARRNPTDANLPMIGEELAASRALSDLAHKLVEAAAEAISEHEGHPVRLQG
jgi:Rv2632c-like